jgi:membrane dipeptidase
MKDQEAADWAATLIATSLVWDAHAGIFPGPDTDLSKVTQWRDCGVDYVSLNIGFDVMPWEQAISTISAYRWVLSEMEGVRIVQTTADIDAARAKRQLAVSFDIEGVNALNGDIGMVSVYRDLGVRQMLLAYNLNNAGSGGCHDQDRGLTAFGRAVIAEMNRVGMILDCSHMGARSSLEAMERSGKPAVFTHSNPVALWPHQRNINDDQVRACAATGGVVGINGMGIFLGDNDTSADTFARHVAHVADLVGPGHVGFGLDWKPKTDNAPDLGAILARRPDFWPKGQGYDTKGINLFHPNVLGDVLILLRKSGWSDGDLCGFLGGNFLRVAEQTWQP